MADARSLAANERQGVVVTSALNSIALDGTLLADLRAGQLPAARAEADRIVFDHRLGEAKIVHIVRLRFTTSSGILVDSNPSNFAVDGPSLALRRADGTLLGTLKVSIQDVGGFVKIAHHLFHFQLVVGGRPGTVTSLRALALQPLPASGCVRITGVTYAVRSFHERSFAGKPVRVWVLSAN